MELKNLIRTKILESVDREITLEFNNDLSEKGVDSLVLIDIIVELEKALSIEILDDDLTVENFKNIDSISNLLKEHYGVSVQ